MMTALGKEGSRYRFTDGRWRELRRTTFSQLLAYRRAVFVDRLGWSLPSHGELELDDFDTESTVYVVCFDGNGDVYGCGRLLPTMGPYLLQRHFPHLVGGAEPPQSRFTWELSRYAAGKPGRHQAGDRGLAGLVFERCLQAAARHGASRVVGVLSLALERIFLRSGVPLQRLGSPQSHESGFIVGCAVDLQPDLSRPLGPSQTGAFARLMRPLPR